MLKDEDLFLLRESRFESIHDRSLSPVDNETDLFGITEVFSQLREAP